MCELFDRINFVLEKLEHEECLCLFSSEELMNELLFKVLSLRSENFEYELLSNNVLRKIVETYIKNVVGSSHTCSSISKLMLFFCDDEIWHKMFNYFKKSKDKFLLYGIAKFLAATFYTFPQHLFSSRMKCLLKDLYQNTDKEKCVYDLELLNCLVEFDSSKYIDRNISKCSNKTTCTISSSEDIFTLFCRELSQIWDTLLDGFLRNENLNVCLFLNLWKHLSERKLNEDFLHIYLNEELAIEFLSLCLKVPSESFKLYVDIISQIFSSNLKESIWKHSEEKKFEEAVLSSLSVEFYHKLSLKNETLSFCSSTCRNPNLLLERSIKFDVASKKVVFIILNLLAEFRNTFLLCEALRNLFDYFAKHIRDWKPYDTYLWIIDTFIEEDDLLFGIMLALVRIYSSLKNSTKRSESNISSVETFITEMNPHKILIKFLQQLGNDHNELLSFLLSDETCCLLYLLHYLKLLLTDWESFIDAHRIISDNLFTTISGDESSTEFNIPSSNKLVSYSSSSSSDEECLGVMDTDSREGIKHLKKLALRTVSVLINLKLAIQKLVDMNEFPYNISPLINLLKICETEFCAFR